MGGIDFKNAAEFLKAGAIALGVGGALVNNQFIINSDYDGICKRAKELTTIISGNNF